MPCDFVSGHVCELDVVFLSSYSRKENDSEQQFSLCSILQAKLCTIVLYNLDYRPWRQEACGARTRGGTET